jgi:alpha-L-arabinofuranosidase
VFRSDFTSAGGWTPEGKRGRWSVADGAYRQEEQAVSFSFAPEIGGADYTVALKARKISGLEGFIIPIGMADGRRVQWNVGGWGNTRHAVQAADAVLGEQVRGTIESGRWYEIRIEVRDRTVRGYLDGQLVQEQTLPRIDKVLAISGRDDKSGDIIVKIVNSAPEAAPMTIDIKGGLTPRSAAATVLRSDDPLDENTFEQPTRIVPKESSAQLRGRSISHTLEPYSLTIIRVKAK